METIAIIEAIIDSPFLSDKFLLRQIRKRFTREGKNGGKVKGRYLMQRTYNSQITRRQCWSFD